MGAMKDADKFGGFAVARVALTPWILKTYFDMGT
jgi:hypothetical protein